MNSTAQRVCVWCGPVMIVVWLGGFLIAGFLPPPDPGASAATIRDMFVDDTFRIRLGLLITMLAAALLVPFSAVIAAQIRRIEGPHQVLASTQLASGALLSVEFIVPIMVLLTAAYRPSEIDPSVVRMLDDMGWLMFVAVTSSAIVQIASIAFAILLDKRARPVFPRWAGYFNAWVAILITPPSLVVFFHHGPFAWRGLISFFFPLTVYATWLITMTVLTYRAVEAQADEAPSEASVEARLAALEARVETTEPIASVQDS